MTPSESPAASIPPASRWPTFAGGAMGQRAIATLAIGAAVFIVVAPLPSDWRAVLRPSGSITGSIAYRARA